MNIDQIVNMVLRTIMRKVINSGINAGIGAFAGKGKQSVDKGNVPGRDVQQTAAQAKKMTRMTRRITRL